MFDGSIFYNNILLQYQQVAIKFSGWQGKEFEFVGTEKHLNSVRVGMIYRSA
jgi:hypothetical protein